MQLAERLKEIRKEQRLTQKEVAEAVHVATRNYQRLEAGGKPAYDTLLALAFLFDVSLDWLTGRTERREVNR